MLLPPLVVGEGRFEDAEKLAAETFRQWRLYAERHPDFAASYALP
jgi:hypothetical protein